MLKLLRECLRQRKDLFRQMEQIAQEARQELSEIAATVRVLDRDEAERYAIYLFQMANHPNIAPLIQVVPVHSEEDPVFDLPVPEAIKQLARQFESVFITDFGELWFRVQVTPSRSYDIQRGIQRFRKAVENCPEPYLFGIGMETDVFTVCIGSEQVFTVLADLPEPISVSPEDRFDSLYHFILYAVLYASEDWRATWDLLTKRA
jgi:hypothetical protein